MSMTPGRSRSTPWALAMVAVAVAVLAGACGSDDEPVTAAASSASSPLSVAPGPDDPGHPRLRLTPGATLSAVSVERICRRGYADSVRNAPPATLDRLFASYGLSGASRSGFEVDYLIPLELGGSNEIANLWPQPVDGVAAKDAVEAALAEMVCDGTLALAEAQRLVVTWESVDLDAVARATTTTEATATTEAPATTTTVSPTTQAPTTTPPPATTTTVPATTAPSTSTTTATTAPTSTVPTTPTTTTTTTYAIPN
ncbi:MAG: hypothetical protein ACT4PW_10415 [Acidimicrobiia bacterium]